MIVKNHDPTWLQMFEAEKLAISLALGDNVRAIHHIGSTAIPNIVAKPIIDILAVASELDLIDSRSAQMQPLDYEAMGEFGISGRRYFRKQNAAGIRTHHVHVYAVGNSEVQRHLDFRDYLIAHPAIAAEYSQLKLRLVEESRRIGTNYQEGKSEFIQRIQQLAALWRQA
ncbi:MAG: GrpB family protein [Planctomycetaceae bacterium]|nr:GrpB family protein [Planctomycetaceae bacterium]